MHTVIILNKHASDLLKDFRFLFRPFIEKGLLSFCDWNEAGRDLASSVPDLYKTIRGKIEWRAVVVSTDSVYSSTRNPAPTESNPFDFPEETESEEIPHESDIPIIRLTHMISGYPSDSVKNFEKGYEYTDEVGQNPVRVRASELSEEELCSLSEKYGDGLRQIYMEEKVSDDVRAAQKAMEEKYSFNDVRPRELYLISMRKHGKGVEHIYGSWKSHYELESSDFCHRNHYPSICRFFCYSITNTENSMYMKELTEFWLSVLTLSMNKIPASVLQAYKLYQLGVRISEKELSYLLNDHLNKMEAVHTFVQERLRMKPEYSFEAEDEVIGMQEIPVVYEEKGSKDLYINTSHIGLSRDCPEDEMMYWIREVRERRENIEKYLKGPRRAIDKASQYMKQKTESFRDDEYELDKFQIEDLKEEIRELELRVLTSDTHHAMDSAGLKEEIEKVDRRVKKDISVRMRKSTVISVGAVLLLIYFGGYLPYLFRSFMLGIRQFSLAMLLVIVTVVLTASGGVAALLILRNRMRRSMEQFNSLMKAMINNVNISVKKFGQYFSTVCTYMKAQAVYSGVERKKERTSSRVYKLRMHKKALKLSIERDEQLATSFGIKRNAEFEKDIVRYFEEDRLPRENRLYYYEPAKDNAEIPLNRAGDMVLAPYTFVAGLLIEREDLYEELKGER